MTTSEDKLDNLKMLVADAVKQASHLERSYNLCASIKVTGSFDEIGDEDLDRLEALVSRFGRLSDIMIQKIFRAIDDIELIRSGTVIDLINGAEKREIIDSAYDFREIRATRNEIEHEYVSSGLAELYQKTLKYSPLLIKACKNLEEYIGRIES